MKDWGLTCQKLSRLLQGVGLKVWGSHPIFSDPPLESLGVTDPDSLHQRRRVLFAKLWDPINPKTLNFPPKAALTFSVSPWSVEASRYLDTPQVQGLIRV